MISPSALAAKYRRCRGQIDERLSQFRQVGQGGDGALFSEMAFCICAANSSADAAYRAQMELEKSGMLQGGGAKEIASVLLKSGVRFHNNKAKYLVSCREKIVKSGELWKRIAGEETPHEIREFLVKEADGIGYKEAGHYLRNIGMGEDLAILDRHIFKNLKSLGVISEKPKSLTGKKYLEIEGKMRQYSKKVGIPLSHLDLLFWSEETGKILK